MWIVIGIVIIVVLAIALYFIFRSSVQFSPFYYYGYSTPTPTPITTATPSSVPNDIDGDGDINDADLKAALEAGGIDLGQLRDMDGDGDIDLLDLVLWIIEIFNPCTRPPDVLPIVGENCIVTFSDTSCDYEGGASRIAAGLDWMSVFASTARDALLTCEGNKDNCVSGQTKERDDNEKACTSSDVCSFSSSDDSVSCATTLTCSVYAPHGGLRDMKTR